MKVDQNTVLLGLILGGGALLYMKMNNNTNTQLLPPNPINNGTIDSKKQEEAEMLARSKFPLKPSSQYNKLVQDLQQKMIKSGGVSKHFIVSTGGADGIFGQGMRNALFALGSDRDQITYDNYLLLSKQLDNDFGFTDFLTNFF